MYTTERFFFTGVELAVLVFEVLSVAGGLV
jgi:hypothetical protein